MSEANRRMRVLNTTQPSNNLVNHAEHLTTDPTYLKLQNELQGYGRQEAIEEHLRLMKLDDGMDGPEVNIKTTALRAIEQRSNAAVTLTWPAVTTIIAEVATSSIFEIDVVLQAFGCSHDEGWRRLEGAGASAVTLLGSGNESETHKTLSTARRLDLCGCIDAEGEAIACGGRCLPVAMDIRGLYERFDVDEPRTPTHLQSFTNLVKIQDHHMFESGEVAHR
ncbi:BZ3500_MvSof-1268-A1-R1_Chr5-2g08083 [Microbotryum saponariae]|uniref:BZ3500_MvSof-1268-A1-R1_Chr5-2g08083 protein n=1 Tax=Microbotryum saponariae TaxID=289078 RepID=A0A2X0NEE9_9BASI|nr:BZ3500_MvSof-1268-A1-R1_Chr5-2g08083 [Microbotryum saponariae]SDA05952.1 BZ3501_MvSof-1269-A2-R1_Chr5-2g07905 [Microbotryum saponariae]